MGDRSSLKAQISYKTGIQVGDYTSRKELFINQAIEEIDKVKWEFKYEVITSVTSLNNQTQASSLPSNFGVIDENNVWLNGEKLVRGSKEEMFFITYAANGQPTKFRMSGTYNDARIIHFSCPKPDAAYTTKIGHWQKLPALTSDSSTSIISQVYGDKPIVSYAVFLMWESMENWQNAQMAMRQFIIDLQLMEERLGFFGPSYAKILTKQYEERYGNTAASG